MNIKSREITKILSEYCADTGDLPRSSSHLSKLEEWLLSRLLSVKMSNYEFEHFAKGAKQYALSKPNRRKGEAYFLYLESNRPDLAAIIRGTEIDPFFDDGKIYDFLLWLCPNHVTTPD